jgi:hypothetical protein
LQVLIDSGSAKATSCPLIISPQAGDDKTSELTIFTGKYSFSPTQISQYKMNANLNIKQEIRDNLFKKLSYSL